MAALFQNKRKGCFKKRKEHSFNQPISEKPANKAFFFSRLRKNSQLTMFIIVGIIIVFLFSLSVFFSEQLNVSKKHLQQDKLSSKYESYIENLLKEASLEVIFKSGLIGFSGTGQKKYTKYNGLSVPYYICSSSCRRPSVTEIEAWLSEKILESFKKEYNEKKLLEAGVFVEHSSAPKVKLTININDVVVALLYNTTLRQYNGSEKAVRINRVSITLPIRLGLVLGSVFQTKFSDTLGIIPLEESIKDSWAGTKSYNLYNFDCTKLAADGSLRIFFADDDRKSRSAKVVRVIDYSTFFSIGKSFMFYFAIKRDPIALNGESCRFSQLQ